MTPELTKMSTEMSEAIDKQKMIWLNAIPAFVRTQYVCFGIVESEYAKMN